MSFGDLKKITENNNKNAITTGLKKMAKVASGGQSHSIPTHGKKKEHRSSSIKPFYMEK